MHCLVTGSEGFIGKNLVARLRENDHHVIEWDIKNGNDLLDKDLRELPDDLEVIYHLACINQMQAVRFPEMNIYVNGLATRSLANRAAEIGVRFVYTSTASVYGNAFEIPTPVNAPMMPLTDYAVAKLAGEYFVRNSGVDYDVYRLSNVYGPHQTLDNPYCGVIGRFIQSALEGKPLQIIGDGKQTRDFTFVDDVVDVLVNHKPFLSDFRVMNLSYGRQTSILELAMLISRCVGEKTEFEWIGQRPIDGIHTRQLKSDFKLPTSVRTGIEETVEWMRAELRRETDPEVVGTA